MNRRVVLLAAVVLLVSLSGCSVLLGDGGTTPSPNVTDTPAGTDAPTATDGPAPGGETTPTAGGSETPTNDESRQTFDAASVNADHVDALEAAGSFTTQSSLVIRNQSTSRYINGSYGVERNGPALNVANITFVVDGTDSNIPLTTRYTEGTATYERRVDDSGNAQYRRGTSPYDDDEPQPVNRTVAYSLGQIARGVVDESSWNATGGGQMEGVDVTRYDTSGEHFAVSGLEANGGATLVVDANGVVRYVAYRFVADVGGERTEYYYRGSYSGVGSTTVEEPAWTDRA